MILEVFEERIVIQFKGFWIHLAVSTLKWAQKLGLPESYVHSEPDTICPVQFWHARR